MTTKLSEQILSIEKTQYLKDLGINLSNSTLVWCGGITSLPYITPKYLLGLVDSSEFKIEAVTTYDLLMLLPPHFYDFPYEDKEKYVIYDLCIERLTGEWLIYYKCTKDMITPAFQGDLIDIVYEMLIWIIENKHF
jgi:hypothetical protein